MTEALLTTSAIEGELLSQGKVRDIYASDGALVLIATDRVSAYDHVLGSGIPGRGIILTQLSNFWFEKFASLVPNHLLETRLEHFSEVFRSHRELDRRAILVRHLQPIDVECVVRGYITGSGWKEYQENGRVCGLRLPPGLEECEMLPEAVFTPAAKNREGHDENISFDRMVEITGGEIAENLRSMSLHLYHEAARHAGERGILIADTKFEFGLDADGKILWMDEALTPDSSRFWPEDDYAPGRSQPSYDKQYLRDWLASTSWDGSGAAPEIPDKVIEGTLKRYLQAYEKLTGEKITL